MENEIIEKIDKSEYANPIKFYTWTRQLIFGKKSPSLLLKIPIYLNICFWLIFQTWHLISYFAISYRDVILSEKKINVEILILNRGAQLNFDPSVFLVHLLNFHFIANFCFALFFIGIILMWRKIKYFTFFIFAPMAIYLLAQIMYMGLRYYNEDITFFDKIVFFLLIANSIFFTVMLRKEDLLLAEDSEINEEID